MAINAAVIARYDAVSLVVQTATSPAGIWRYHASMLRPQRILRTYDRKWREARMVARGFQSASHPILAQIVPIRRGGEPLLHPDLGEIMPASGPGAVSVRALRWTFGTGPRHDRFRAVAARLLGSRAS